MFGEKKPGGFVFRTFSSAFLVPQPTDQSETRWMFLWPVDMGEAPQGVMRFKTFPTLMNNGHG